MQLWAPRGDRTCVVIGASLLSEVAARLSVVKTNEVEKSYKEFSGALDLKHREAMSCDRKNKQNLRNPVDNQ